MTQMRRMSQSDWRHFEKSTLVRNALMQLKNESAIDKKTYHLEFVLLKPAAYLF